MNDDNEIIYKGFGEITYEAADLVIKLNIVKSKFSLTTEENIKFPIVTSTASVSKNQTHVLVNTLDSTVKVSIPEDHKNILRLKRVNGEAYDIHRAIAIVLVTILTIVSSYQILRHGFMENTSLSIMPVFGLGYFLIVEIIARIIFKNLCKKVEKIMNTEGVVYTKL